MELTKKLLEARLVTLETNKLQAIGQVNAIEGGMIMIRDLLNELDREESKVEGEGQDSCPSAE